MRNLKATFLGSFNDPGKIPQPSLPEIALAGRSNVGKSSLINALVGSKIALISATPGKTRTLNFYRVEDRLILVDLPGYGYAKVSGEQRNLWKPMVEGYVERRVSSEKTLKAVVCIMDIRRGPEEEEDWLMAWLRHHGVAAPVVLTKADKLKTGERKRAYDAVSSRLPGEVGKPLLFSARTGMGQDDLWKMLLSFA